MNRSFLLEYSGKISDFINSNHLEDKDHNLIMDYIETLYNKGVDLHNRDFEKEIYIFYNYHKKYNDILQKMGEDEFINLITDAEIFEMKIEYIISN